MPLRRRSPAWLVVAPGWIALALGPFASAAEATPHNTATATTTTTARHTQTTIPRPTHAASPTRPPIPPRLTARLTGTVRPARPPAPATPKPQHPTTTTRPRNVQPPPPPRLAHPIPHVAHQLHHLAAAAQGPWSPLKKGLFAGLFAVLCVGVICWVWLIERATGKALEPDAAQERAEVAS